MFKQVVNLNQANLLLSQRVCVLMAACALIWVPIALVLSETIVAILCLIEVMGYGAIYLWLKRHAHAMPKAALAIWFNLAIFICCQLLPPTDGSIMLFAAVSTYTISIFSGKEESLYLYSLLGLSGLLIVVLLSTNFSMLPLPATQLGEFGLALNIFTTMSIIYGVLLLNRKIIQGLQQNLLDEKLESESANKAKSAFLSNISHEIRNPMQGIMGVLENITSANELSPSLDAMARSALCINQNLVVIINDVLDYSKLEEKHFTLHNRAFSPQHLVEKCEQVYKLKLASTNVILFVKTHDLPMNLMGDEVRIFQILNNVVNNSIKFTVKGSISISVNYNKSNLVIRVSDTGIGMNASTLKSLFSRFSQGDESISKTYEGTGLGMAISFELITLMNGNINVESELGKGTETTIKLPLIPVVKDDSVSLNTSKKVNLNNKSILLVDDNDMNLIIYESQLSGAGASVVTASSVKEAISLLNQEFDLILTDICMPELSGVDFIHHLNDVKFSNPVVAITGSISEQAVEEYNEAGFYDVLAKPIPKDQLIARLSEIVN